MSHEDPLLTTLDASRVLDLSPDAVRRLARMGKLLADEETPSGMRLFRKSTVDAYAEHRRLNPEPRGRPRKAPKKVGANPKRSTKRRRKAPKK